MGNNSRKLRRNKFTRRKKGGSWMSPFNLVRRYREYKNDKDNGLAPNTTRNERKKRMNMTPKQLIKKNTADVLEDLSDRTKSGYFLIKEKSRKALKEMVL